MEKISAHRDGGSLHRAISVLLFDSEGRILIQKRAADKYHFGGYWANTCCSHPAPGEAPLEAALRTLQREMGMGAELDQVGEFVYRATDAESGLTEWEYDHVFFGKSQAAPAPNPNEVSEIAWLTPSELQKLIDEKREEVSPWLIEIFDRFQHQFCIKIS